MAMIGVSNYHALNTLNIDYADYLDRLGNVGVQFTRSFTDLPVWLTPKGMNPDNSCFLYQYDPIAKRYRSDKFNLAFIERLNAAGKVAKKHGMMIRICILTDPSYYKDSIHKSYSYQLGYRNADELFHKGDFVAKQWEGIKKYCADLAKVIADLANPAMFSLVELANEWKSWGSVLDECVDMMKALRSERPSLTFQINPPYTEEVPDTWARRLVNGVKGFKAKKISMHGIFKPSEMEFEVDRFNAVGISRDVLSLSTDGATPNGIFSREHSTGHYKWREDWTKTPANTKATIDAHVALVKKAIDLRVDLDIQDVVKWSHFKETPEHEKFLKAIGKAIG